MKRAPIVERLVRIECAMCEAELPDVAAETAHFAASPACAERAEVMHHYEKQRVLRPATTCETLTLFSDTAGGAIEGGVS